MSGLHFVRRNITQELGAVQDMVERLADDLQPPYAERSRADQNHFQARAEHNVRDKFAKNDLLKEGSLVLVGGVGGFLETTGIVGHTVVDLKHIVGGQILRGTVSWPIVGLAPPLDILPITTQNSTMSALLGLTGVRFGSLGNMKDLEDTLYLPLAYRKLKIYKLLLPLSLEPA